MSTIPWPGASCDGAYIELDLSDNTSLQNRLNALLDTLHYDASRHRTDRYDADLLPTYSRSRVTAAALTTILQENPRKNTAAGDQNVIALKNVALDEITPLIKEVFHELIGEQPYGRIGPSGQFWYPHNGYMGWHTNSAARGCRLYCTHVREAGRSFFRYREPASGQIKTSWDAEGWHFRLFKIGSEPLWHAVYSETDRISLGFKLTPPPPKYGRPGGVR